MLLARAGVRVAICAWCRNGTIVLGFKDYWTAANEAKNPVVTRLSKKSDLSLPDGVVQGEPARLFPILSESSKEGRALSILLACVERIPEFANELFASLGLKFGRRRQVEAYTEVVFKNDGHGLRPDGLLTVRSGKTQWSALVEAKIGGKALEKEQLESYLRLARDNGIDAVITISNAFAVIPEHHPVTVSKQLVRKTLLLHWSWVSLLTQAKLLLEIEGIDDVDHQDLAQELDRFLSHKSTGIKRFDQMPPTWREINGQVAAGAPLRPSSPSVRDVVGAWRQEIRDLALQLTNAVGVPVKIHMPRAAKSDPSVWERQTTERLCGKHELTADYQIPNAAAPMSLNVDLRSNMISASMTLKAPEDRKTPKARLNWLLRQLRKTEATDLHVRADYGRGRATQAPLEDIREDADALFGNAPFDGSPKAFIITLTKGGTKRFNGAKTFIEDIEALATDFYERVGQRLAAWRPPAPTVRTERFPEQASPNPVDEPQVEANAGQAP